MQGVPTTAEPDPNAQRILERAGLATEATEDWLGSQPVLTGDYRLDVAESSHFWVAGTSLLDRLPSKPKIGRAHV